MGALLLVIGYLVQFMANHHMLTLGARPPWRVVTGGSATYVEALRRRWRVQERLSSPVLAVRRDADGVELDSLRGRERFGQVVLACHSDDALGLMQDADARERDILGAIERRGTDAIRCFAAPQHDVALRREPALGSELGMLTVDER